MFICKQGDGFLLRPQTSLDHIFIEKLFISGRVDEACALSLLSLRSNDQPLTIGQLQQGMRDHCKD